MRRTWLVLVAALAAAVPALGANYRRPAAPYPPRGSPHRGWARARAPPQEISSQAKHPFLKWGDLMRRLIIATMLALAMAALAALPAWAGSPHFVGTPTITRSGDALTVAGKVAGLGDETQINVALTADVACINPGNNQPKAENKGATIAEGTFPVQNGKANFSVTGVGTTSPDCSPPMTLRYSNVVVTVSGDSFDPDLVFAFPGTF